MSSAILNLLAIQPSQVDAVFFQHKVAVGTTQHHDDDGIYFIAVNEPLSRNQMAILKDANYRNYPWRAFKVFQTVEGAERASRGDWEIKLHRY